MHTHLDVPLDQLRLSPANARQDPGNVNTLAHSIAAVGLITPLAVTRNHSGYLVEAGGRRLAALQLLRDQGKLSADAPVPVMLFNSPDLARSVAENTEREPMDPLQQAQAFGRLLGEGRHVEDIATTFGVSVQYVRQRAKLAELVPEVVEAWRQKRLDLQQCAALTFGTPEQQRAIVADPGYLPGAMQLRERLRGALVRQDDRRVKFVSLQAYQAAGGRLVEDLFASTADLVDVELLDQLVEDKLIEASLAENDRGAGFVVLVGAPGDRGQQHLWGMRDYNDPPPLVYAPTAEQQRRINEIEERQKAIEERLEDIEDGSDEHISLSNEWDLLEEEYNSLSDAANRPDGISIGVLLAIGPDGTLARRPVVRTADLIAREKAEGSGESTGDAAAPGKPADKPDLPVKCVEEIAQTRQAALALKVAAMPGAALAVIVQWLDFATFGPLSGVDQPMTWHNPAPFHAFIRRCATERPDDLSEQLRAVTLRTAAERRHPLMAERTRDQNAKDCIPLAWYLGQPKTALLQILADCVAHALTDPDSGTRDVADSARPTIQALADACELDLADYWKPTAPWLKSYGRVKTLQALQEIDPALSGALAKAKAGEVYAKAAERLAEARWVPEVGR